MKPALIVVLALSGCAAPGTQLELLLADDPPKEAEKAVEPPGARAPIPEAVARAVEVVLKLQEGDPKAEWPYEGVYRVGGKIPIGYRVGGTGICSMMLLRAPGYEGDGARKAAVARAAAFVVGSIHEPLMSAEAYDAGYDVRGWGYTFGLHFLLTLKAKGAVPAGAAEGVEGAIASFIAAIEKTEIPKAGGWNYARPAGKGNVAPSSGFMTPATLQALFEAARQGYRVDGAVVERALDSMERMKTGNGAIVYAGEGSGKRSGEPVPGAVGRMAICETTLYLAGRGGAKAGDTSAIRGAVDAFIVHWGWLDKRRAQPGTHIPPYNIAPYYFFFAHYYAAQAVEMLPEREREEYRRRINDLLFSVRNEDGSWNDRVFPRTANYGTAMSAMALLMPGTERPASWGEKPADGKREEKKAPGG